MKYVCEVQRAVFWLNHSAECKVMGGMPSIIEFTPMAHEWQVGGSDKTFLLKISIHFASDNSDY